MNNDKNYGSDVSSLESDEYSNNDAIKILNDYKIHINEKKKKF